MVLAAETKVSLRRQHNETWIMPPHSQEQSPDLPSKVLNVMKYDSVAKKKKKRICQFISLLIFQTSRESHIAYPHPKMSIIFCNNLVDHPDEHVRGWRRLFKMKQQHKAEDIWWKISISEQSKFVSRLIMSLPSTLISSREKQGPSFKMLHRYFIWNRLFTLAALEIHTQQCFGMRGTILRVTRTKSPVSMIIPRQVILQAIQRVFLKQLWRQDEVHVCYWNNVVAIFFSFGDNFVPAR